jgi:chromosome segregation ATPase
MERGEAPSSSGLRAGDGTRACALLATSAFEELREQRIANPDLHVMAERIRGLEEQLASSRGLVENLQAELGEGARQARLCQAALSRGFELARKMDAFASLLNGEVQDPSRKFSTIERNLQVLADRLHLVGSLRAENDTLKSAIQAARDENQILVDQLGKKTQENRRLQDHIDADAAARQQLSEAQNRCRDLEGANESLAAQSSELQAAIAASESTIAALTDQVASLTTELKALRAREAALSGQFERSIAESKKSGDGLAAELLQLREHRSALESDNVGLRAQVEALTALRRDLEAREGEVRELRLQNKELVQQQRSEQNQIAEAHQIESARMRELSIANEQLADDLQASEASLKESRSEVTSLTDEVTKLRRTLAQETAKAAELQKTVDRDFEEFGRLYSAQAELALRQNADAATVPTPAEVEQVPEQLRELVEVAAHFNIEIFDLRELFERLSVENTELSAELERQKAKVEQGEVRIAGLEKATELVERLQTELDGFRASQSLLKQRNAALDKDLASLQAALGHKEGEIARLSQLEAQSQLRSAEAETVASLEQTIEQLNGDVVAYKDELQRLGAENATLMGVAEESRSQLATLKAEMSLRTSELTLLKQSSDKSTEDLKREIVNVYAELNERRERDGAVHQTQQERDQMLRDIGAFELHIFGLTTACERLESERSRFIERIASLASQRDELITGIEALEYDRRMWNRERADTERQVQDTTAEIQRLKQRLEVEQRVNASLQQSLNDTEHRIATAKLPPAFSVRSDADESLIAKYHGENLELKSRVSVLEGELQLAAVLKRDQDVQELQSQLQKSEATAKKIGQEADELRTANHALELRLAEVDARLADEAQLQSQIVALRAERNALDLRSEQLSHELDESKSEIDGLRHALSASAQKAAELNEALSEPQAQSAQTDINHLKIRSRVVRLEGELADLRSQLRLAQSEKTALQSSIERLNDRHQRELEALSQAIKGSEPDNISVTLITQVTQDRSDLQKRLHAASQTLRNEAAEHLATKQRLVEQEKINQALIAKYGDMESDHVCLVKTVGDIFGCNGPISATIATLARAGCRLRQLQAEPAQGTGRLQYELNKTQTWLELEKKKNRLLETRLRNQGPRQDAGLAECVLHFLDAFTEDGALREMGTGLLEGSRDCRAWQSFGARVARATGGARGQAARFEKQMRTLFIQIAQRLEAVEERIKAVIVRARGCQAKRKTKKSHIPKPAGSLFERSVKLRPSGDARTPMGVVTDRRFNLPRHIPPALPRQSTPSGVSPPAMNSFL